MCFVCVIVKAIEPFFDLAESLSYVYRSRLSGRTSRIKSMLASPCEISHVRRWRAKRDEHDTNFTSTWPPGHITRPTGPRPRFFDYLTITCLPIRQNETDDKHSLCLILHNLDTIPWYLIKRSQNNGIVLRCIKGAKMNI